MEKVKKDIDEAEKYDYNDMVNINYKAPRDFHDEAKGFAGRHRMTMVKLIMIAVKKYINNIESSEQMFEVNQEKR